MRKILDKIRRSFSMRLSLWVVIFAALVFLLAQGYSSLEARRSVKTEAILRATQVLENSTLRLGAILQDVEEEADDLEWLVFRHLDSRDTLMEYTRNTVLAHPMLNGCSISFEPYYFKDELYFSAYSGKVGGTVQTEQEGGDDYQYFYLDWYLLPKLLKQPCWTEPYSDWEQDDAEDLQTQMQVSYCKPLLDADGNFFGSISLDLSLRWLSEQLASVKPYPHSYSILVSRGGTFIVHPDPERLFYETVFTRGLDEANPQLMALGRSMQSMEAGMRSMKVDGVKSYVFYTPLKSTGWSMGIVCPERDIFGGFNHLRRISLLIALLALLMMFALCVRIIRGAVKPLSALATQAEEIASGRFDDFLPETDRIDEIGTLSRSFSHMQTSLVSYIDELTRTTANKVRMEGELQIARDIQMGMIPRTFPPFPERKDIDLYASMVPAREVGGDLYDFFLQEGKLYFCIGDVSGKGVPASLFMATTRNLFRIAGKQGLPPAEIARQINDTLSEGNEQLMFVTMFLGMLDLGTGDLAFCNCGHNPPVVLTKAGKPAFLPCKPNTSLGILSGYVFEGEHIKGLRGKPLFLYTDGLNEAENLSHEQFGTDRLLAVLGEPYTDARNAVMRLSEAVAAHVGDAQASDDLTMLCLEWKG
jgi:sigma-B regulation protein RsbU (phosphoserine phosphatase)